MRDLNLGNACYCLVQNSLSSYLQVKNINYDYAVLYGCETWFVTLPEHGMGAEEDDWTKSGMYMRFEKFAYLRRLITFTLQQENAHNQNNQIKSEMVMEHDVHGREERRMVWWGT